MANLFNFEYYKLNKQKRFLILIATTFIFQLLMAIFIKYNEDFMSYERAIQYSFLAPYVINVSIIFLACTMLTEDFEHLTIVPIKMKYPNLSKLISVKLILILFTHIVLLFLSACFTILLAYTLLNYDLNLAIISDVYLYSLTMILPIATIILLAAIASLITKKEKTGLIISLIIYLLYGLGTGLNFLIIQNLPVFKYGIVNLMNLSNQLIDSRYIEMTQLSHVNMITVIIVYLIIESIILFILSKKIEL